MTMVASRQRDRSVAKFIDELGGTPAVAEKTGHRAGTIYKWRCVNVLPRSAWPEVLKAFPEVSVDALLALEARQ